MEEQPEEEMALQLMESAVAVAVVEGLPTELQVMVATGIVGEAAVAAAAPIAQVAMYEVAQAVLVATGISSLFQSKEKQ
jgi:hypothetical protein